MSKERLEDIKDRYMELEYDFNLRKEDIDWLIERVQELELEVNDWRAEVQKWQKFYKESEESHLETKELLHSTIIDIKRYKQALEEITQLGWSDNFGGGHNYMGEHHAQAIKISEKALDGDLDE